MCVQSRMQSSAADSTVFSVLKHGRQGGVSHGCRCPAHHLCLYQRRLCNCATSLPAAQQGSVQPIHIWLNFQNVLQHACVLVHRCFPLSRLSEGARGCNDVKSSCMLGRPRARVNNCYATLLAGEACLRHRAAGAGAQHGPAAHPGMARRRRPRQVPYPDLTKSSSYP